MRRRDTARVTPDDFAAALDEVARAGADGLLRYLDAPAGRTPPSAWVSRSEWFQSLSGADRAAVEDLVHQAAVATARNVCCVLDGTLAIEPAGPKGRLVLTYVDPDGSEVRLNDPEVCLLDEAFGAIQRDE